MKKRLSSIANFLKNTVTNSSNPTNSVSSNSGLPSEIDTAVKQHMDVARHHYQQRDVEQAIIDYGKAIELDPENANAYGNRGVAYLQSGNLEKAFDNLSKAIELDSSNAAVFYNVRGAAYRA